MRVLALNEAFILRACIVASERSKRKFKDEFVHLWFQNQELWTGSESQEPLKSGQVRTLLMFLIIAFLSWHFSPVNHLSVHLNQAKPSHRLRTPWEECSFKTYANCKRNLLDLFAILRPLSFFVGSI